MDGVTATSVVSEKSPLLDTCKDPLADSTEQDIQARKVDDYAQSSGSFSDNDEVEGYWYRRRRVVPVPVPVPVVVPVARRPPTRACCCNLV